MAFRLPYLFVLLLLLVSDVDIYSNTSSIPQPVCYDTTINNSSPHEYFWHTDGHGEHGFYHADNYFILPQIAESTEEDLWSMGRTLIT